MRTGALLIMAGCIAVLPSTSAAQRSMVLERFHSELRVNLDGSVEVTESLRVRFSGEWEGIYRDLSLEHRSAEGRLELLRLELVSITSDAGEPLEYRDRSWTREGMTRRFQVWVPDARDATRTVVLQYRLSNVIRFFDERSPEGPLDELYWNVTGHLWEIPIEESGARIVLPEGVLPNQWAAYTGPAGSIGSDVGIDVAGSTVSFQTTRALDPWEGLTVAVGWEPGAVARPQPPSKLRRLARGGWPMVLPLLTFFLVFGRWRKEGRDPKRRPITVQYEPPENLSPTEAGTLVDHKVQMRDIAAALVDLAVRGYILIEARPRPGVVGPGGGPPAERPHRPALRPDHACQDARGSPGHGMGPGLQGVPGQGGGGSLQEDDHFSGDVRTVPPLCRGVPGGGQVGQGLRGHVLRASPLVLRGRQRGFPDLLLRPGPGPHVHSRRQRHVVQALQYLPFLGFLAWLEFFRLRGGREKRRRERRWRRGRVLRREGA